MRHGRITRSLAMCATVLLTGLSACGDSNIVSARGNMEISISDGGSQTARAGSVVPVPPSIVVTQNGAPQRGLAVTFAVTAGGGAATGASAITDSEGIARVGSWTLGATPGTNALTATVTNNRNVSIVVYATGN